MTTSVDLPPAWHAKFLVLFRILKSKIFCRVFLSVCLFVSNNVCPVGCCSVMSVCVVVSLPVSPFVNVFTISLSFCMYVSRKFVYLCFCCVWQSDFHSLLAEADWLAWTRLRSKQTNSKLQIIVQRKICCGNKKCIEFPKGNIFKMLWTCLIRPHKKKKRKRSNNESTNESKN